MSCLGALLVALAPLSPQGPPPPAIVLELREPALHGQLRGPAVPIDDLDGDGLDDLVLGMPEVEFGELQYSRVVAWSASGRVLWEAPGRVLNDRLGHDLDAGADLDADGLDDVVAGAPFTSLAGYEYSGSARVLSGRVGRGLFDVFGAEVGAHFGSAVKFCGDLDLDGVPDFAVGSPNGSAGAAFGGSVRAYGGRTGALLWHAPGTDDNAALGSSLAALPDVDGDGVPDVASGTPRQGVDTRGGYVLLSGATGSPLVKVEGPLPFGAMGTSLVAWPAAGALLLVSGAPFARNRLGEDVGALVLTRLDGSLLDVQLGSVQGSEFGASLAAGDLDLDGAWDLAAGSRFEPNGLGESAGAVRVYLSTTGFLPMTLDAKTPGEQFGQYLAIGDGALVVGSPLTSFPGNPIAGSVRILTAAGETARELGGMTAGVGLGAAAASIGDVNGDGHDDFAVAAPTWSTETSDYVGQVRIHSGRGGARLYVLDGAGEFHYFGSSIATAGDVDLDGVPDLAVASPTASTMAVLDAGIVEVFSGPVRIARLEGSEPGQDFGRAIAEAGDVNLDGVPDLAVAAPHGTAPGGPSAGRVTVFAGGSNAPLAESGGDIDGGQFGYALASAPDASAPGGRRLVIGQPSGLVNGLTSPGYVRAWRPGVAGFAWTAAGSSAGDAFGWSVSSGVDLDGDGGFETAAGAPNAHGGRGEVKVLGPAGLVAWSSPGMEDSGQLGFAVSLVPEPPAGGGGRVAGGAPGAAVPHVFPGAPAPATGTGAGLVKLWTGGGASVGEARGIVGGSAMGFALTAAILRSASPAGDPTIVLVVGAPIEAANGIVRLLAVP